MAIHTFKTERGAQRAIKRFYDRKTLYDAGRPQWFVTVEPYGFRYAIAAMINGRKVYLGR